MVGLPLSLCGLGHEPRCVVDLPPGREPRCVVDLPLGHEPRCVVDLPPGSFADHFGPCRKSTQIGSFWDLIGAQKELKIDPKSGTQKDPQIQVPFWLNKNMLQTRATAIFSNKHQY